MDWNWDHIRFFLALTEKGTLSVAARSLGVSHSTVQRRIRQLETELNTQLFDHTNTGYSLTPAGETLHAEAIKMHSTMSALSREISGADSQMEGSVVITTTDTLAKYILPKLISNLSDKYPDIRFSLLMTNNLNDLNERDIDIAVRTGRQAPEHLIGRRVADVRFEAVASCEYAQHHNLSAFPINIEAHRFIMLDESYATAPFHQWLNQRIELSKRITTVNNFLCAAAMAGEGLGITVLPSYMANTESNLVKLSTQEEISRNELWVLSHTDSRKSEKVRVVRQYLYEALASELN